MKDIDLRGTIEKFEIDLKKFSFYEPEFSKIFKRSGFQKF